MNHPMPAAAPEALPSQPAQDLCLDPQAMGTLLAGLLPECVHEGWELQALRLDKVRRSSSLWRNPVPLTLCYEAQLGRPDGSATSPRLFYAKLYRDAAVLQQARDQAGDGVLQARHPALAGHGLLLWPWPLDPGLPQLRTLMDPRAADDWWGQRAASVRALRHEPERRASLCYASAPEPGAVQRVYAKTFFDDRGELIHRRFSHFWQQAQLDPEAPTVAEPLGYCTRQRAVWQAEARGLPLTRRLTDMPAPQRQRLPVRLARALASVHRAPKQLLGNTVRDPAHWLKEVERRRNKICRVAPELAGLACEVADRVGTAAQRIAPFDATVIHGDCHPDQVWLDGERVVLFDFDEFVLGDPMEDLAEFVTKLGGDGLAGALGPLLLAAYAQQAPEHFDLARLRWHLAVQSLLQAGRAYKFQRPAWRDEVRAHLDRAATLTDTDTQAGALTETLA